MDTLFTMYVPLWRGQRNSESFLFFILVPGFLQSCKMGYTCQKVYYFATFHFSLE